MENVHYKMKGEKEAIKKKEETIKVWSPFCLSKNYMNGEEIKTKYCE